MRELGYENEIKELLDKMKSKEFVKIHEETSVDLTLEFLSTLKVEKDHSLSFRLCDEEKTLTNE